MKLKKKLFLLCIVSIFTLISCGGGGGGTSSDDSATTTSAIDENAEDLALAAKETSAQILASEDIDSSGLRVMSDGISPATLLKGTLPTSTKKAGFLAESEDLIEGQGTVSDSGSISGDCGGSASYTLDGTYDDADTYPMTYDYDITYNNFCVSSGGYEFEFSGTLNMYGTWSSSSVGSFEYVYNTTYTSNMPDNASGSLTYSETCDYNDGDLTCSTGVYEGGSTTYHTSGVSVSGDATSGYDVSYSIVDSDGNTWSVEFTDLTLCDSGNIGSGSGTVVYNGDTITIEFISCSQFQVTYDGNTETYEQ